PPRYIHFPYTPLSRSASGQSSSEMQITKAGQRVSFACHSRDCTHTHTHTHTQTYACTFIYNEKARERPRKQIKPLTVTTFAALLTDTVFHQRCCIVHSIVCYSVLYDRLLPSSLPCTYFQVISSAF